MMTSTCICDRCGDIILEGRSLLTVDSGPLRTHRATVDLCPGCSMAFQGFLATNRDEPFELSAAEPMTLAKSL